MSLMPGEQGGAKGRLREEYIAYRLPDVVPVRCVYRRT
jgi:hypothetical protein